MNRDLLTIFQGKNTNLCIPSKITPVQNTLNLYLYQKLAVHE